MDPVDLPDEEETPRLSRRRFLAAAVAGGLAVGLAACGQELVSPAVPSRASPAPLPTPSREPVVPASPSPPASTPSPDPSALGITLERMIAGLVVVGFRGVRLADAAWVRAAVDAGLGGVILFDRDQQHGGARNVVSPDQVRSLTAELVALRPAAPVIVAIDQEGGIVTRLSPDHGFPAVRSEAAIGAGTVADARRWARGLAGTLATAGITLNLAPVVDLDVNPASPAIGALGRSFSADADVVVRLAAVEVDAHRAVGVATALKHFPGIGSSVGNTDDGLVDVTGTWTRRELGPFRRLIGSGEADVVMVGHVINRHIDPDRPASLSPAFVEDLLRSELGWAGPTITDDLQAAAIAASHGPGAAARLALAAGNDLLLVANQRDYDDRVVDTIVSTVARAVADGTLARDRVEEAYARVASRFGWTA